MQRNATKRGNEKGSGLYDTRLICFAIIALMLGPLCAGGDPPSFGPQRMNFEHFQTLAPESIRELTPMCLGFCLTRERLEALSPAQIHALKPLYNPGLLSLHEWSFQEFYQLGEHAILECLTTYLDFHTTQWKRSFSISWLDVWRLDPARQEALWSISPTTNLCTTIGTPSCLKASQGAGATGLVLRTRTFDAGKRLLREQEVLPTFILEYQVKLSELLESWNNLQAVLALMTPLERSVFRTLSTN